MPFPESARNIYNKNPLEQVICQLRFPPILRIESEPPAAFQERVRKDYPLFQEKRGTADAMGLPPELEKILSRDLPIRLNEVNYEFTSADEIWKLNLAREFLALTTCKYENWGMFRDRFGVALSALIEEYKPPFFDRVGLRYRDVIRRSELGLDGVAWSELLNPHIAGELCSPAIASEIQAASHTVAVRLEGSSHVRIRHGLARRKGLDEECYLIDSDFFSEERVETSHATELLDYFKKQAARLFRWSIRDRLHEAMGPHKLD